MKKKLSFGMDMEMKVNTRDISAHGQPEKNPQSPCIKLAHVRIEF